MHEERRQAMPFTFWDALFLVGLLFIIVPLFIANMLVGTFVTGVIMIVLALKLGQRGGG